MNVLASISKNIYSIDKKSMDKAQARWDNLIHPPGSLGRLEDICVSLAGIYRDSNLTIPNKIILSFAADHGVYEEGVSNDPRSLTRYQIPNFVNGKCGVATLCKNSGADIMAIDVGIDYDKKIEGVLDYKIRRGTSNMAKGPAMTRDEAIKSLEIGIELAEIAIVKGNNMIGIGEMGICNTTAAAAITSVMTGFDPIEVTGLGATLSKDQIPHKAGVIRKAIELNNPNPTDGIDVLSKVGGFEIGAMAGVILGAAANQVPVVLDGYISYAACMIAYRINPKSIDYVIASHISKESGSMKALDFLGLKPFLYMDMKLGEGSGAALAFTIIDAAIFSYLNMATFNEVDLGERGEEDHKNKQLEINKMNR